MGFFIDICLYSVKVYPVYLLVLVFDYQYRHTSQVPCLFWQGHLCNSRTDGIKELLRFGKDIKVFLQSRF